jgi:diguanylate cyclase (GGDEF)-like protein
LVLANDTDLAQAQQLAERLAEAVRNVPFAEHIRVTLSVGVTCYKSGDNLARLLSRADAALYRAKEAGRDRLDVIETTDAGLLN